MQMLQKMSHSARIFRLVTTSAFDEDRQTKQENHYLAIFDSMISVATVIPFPVLERSEWKVRY